MASEDPTLPARDDAAPAPVGRCGRYVVLGPIGAGGMGMVLVAYDPALDRRVALKLLHPRSTRPGGPGAAPIEREAQAMARLSHPNVVSVFDVNQVGDQTFVAMELVEGSTLRAWLAERPRPWREIVDMFVAAGRGLAAAHAAGLVHRDFKPDNVLIGRDGRPRISDFGLVCDAAGDAGAFPEGAPRGTIVSNRGSAVGTPAYMSPEQWAGRPVDGRGDQFAFCVALWEALARRRPFAGLTPSEFCAAVQAGAVIEPSGRPSVPRRLQAALRRGLAIDPAARWPDMPALLDVLAGAAERRRQPAVAALVASTAIAAVAGVLAPGARRAPEVCAAPTARLSAMWSPARRDLLRVRLVALDRDQGATRLAKLSSVLDLGARDWSAMHIEVCRATRIDGRQSDTLLDRRMECLDQWLGELDDTVCVVELAGDHAALDRAVHAVANLSPLAVCVDLRVLGDAPG